MGELGTSDVFQSRVAHAGAEAGNFNAEVVSLNKLEVDGLSDDHGSCRLDSRRETSALPTPCAAHNQFIRGDCVQRLLLLLLLH